MADNTWYTIADPNDHDKHHGRTSDYPTALQIAQAIATQAVIDGVNKHVVVLEMPSGQVLAMLRALDTLPS